MFGRLFGRSGRVAVPKKMETCFQDVATDNLHCFQVSHFAIYFGAANIDPGKPAAEVSQT